MDKPFELRENLRELLAGYAARQPLQAARAADFQHFIASEADCAQRSLSSGHLTGSAWLVSADGNRVLLLHHRKLARWLQPGGHADGDLDLRRVALTEATEETGLTGLMIEAEIFDLDVHQIPARGTDPAHLHWDVRFVVQAGADERFAGNSESLSLAWFDIAELASAPDTEESLRRMALSWLARAAL